MANWEAYRIGDIVSDIDDKKFVLPVIQRRLVWEEEKMELLFDTLLKGDSFGGIMVIKEEKNSKPLFSFRPFAKDGKLIESIEVDKIQQNQSFVIDGQQRLQSFYIGLSGTINGKILYFDLFSNFNIEFEFKFEGDSKKLLRQAKDDSSKTIKSYKWYPAAQLFQKLKQTNNDKTVGKNIIAAEGITDEEEKDHILENVAAFYRSIIGGKSLGMCEVAIDKTFDETQNRQRIVELFRRLNDGGTRLSPFDLVVSVLKGFEWHMEGFLEKTLTEYSDIGLTQDNLIKLIFLLQDNHKKEMTDIGAADAQFAIDQSDRIKSTLTCLKKFLVFSDLEFYFKDGNRSFVPLFFVAYHVFHKKITNQQIEAFFDNHDANNPEFIRIKRWIYYSLINGVFKSKGAGWTPYKTGIRKILEVITNYKDKDFPIDELFDVYYEHGVVFKESFDVANLDSLDSQFLYFLIYDRKQSVRVQDIDHIMPKSILESMQYDWAKINNIKNFQLLDFGTNRWDKNATPFKQWMDSLPDKRSFTLRHLIPADEQIWTEDRFEDFIEKRGLLILSKVDQYVSCIEVPDQVKTASEV